MSEGKPYLKDLHSLSNENSRGATPETVKKAFELLLTDKAVTSILLNVFGGIMRCDYIAEGVIKATKELQLRVPLVVRLQGNKEAEAKK